MSAEGRSCFRRAMLERFIFCSFHLVRCEHGAEIIIIIARYFQGGKASREWKTNLMKKMAFYVHKIHFNLLIYNPSCLKGI